MSKDDKIKEYKRSEAFIKRSVADHVFVKCCGSPHVLLMNVDFLLDAIRNEITRLESL